MRREPLHGPPAIVGDVGLCERPRRESQRDGEDDQRREAAGGDEDRLDPARARATQTRGQAANADRGEDANRHVERVEQPALDVRDVGQVEQRQHQRWPDNEERQAAVAAPPGEHHPDRGGHRLVVWPPALWRTSLTSTIISKWYA